MEIIDYYYNENEEILEIRFSVDPDSDYYKGVNLSLEDVLFYSPTILEEDEIPDLEEEDVLEILKEYFQENELPTEDLF